MELPLRRTFYPLGFAVEILSNHPKVLEAAAESFGHRRLSRGRSVLQLRVAVQEGGGTRLPPEPVRRAYNHLFSLIADPHNSAMLDLRARAGYIWLSNAALRNPLYLRHNFLEKAAYLMLSASVVTDIHAACVSKNRRGVLLCGSSGAGKSTLAYACARAGWTYTSDDTSYLLNGSDPPRVVGHSHRIRFRPPAADLFPELTGREVTPRMEGKPSIEVPTVHLPSIMTAAEVDIHFVVYLNRNPGAAAVLLPLAYGTALQRSRRDLFSIGEIRATQESNLEPLSNTPAYELQYSTSVDAIDRLSRLIESI